MNPDTKNLPPEVAAYIRSLEQKNQQLEKQLVKMQSLNEQLVKMRKRMFGQSSEQIQYVDARQLDFFNEAEVCSDASAPEPGENDTGEGTCPESQANQGRTDRRAGTQEGGLRTAGTLDRVLPSAVALWYGSGKSLSALNW